MATPSDEGTVVPLDRLNTMAKSKSLPKTMWFASVTASSCVLFIQFLEAALPREYSLTSSPAPPTINILAPSSLKAIPLGAVSCTLTERLSVNAAVDTSNPVPNVYL